MLNETDIEQLIDLVIADVQLFKLLKRLDALYLFELASTDMEDANVFEGGTYVTESRYNRVV